jgi:hypothetical protein
MCCNPDIKAHASVMESVQQLFSNVINILMVMAMTTTMMIPAMTNNSGVVNSKIWTSDCRVGKNVTLKRAVMIGTTSLTNNPEKYVLIL